MRSAWRYSDVSKTNDSKRMTARQDKAMAYCDGQFFPFFLPVVGEDLDWFVCTCE